MDARLARNSLGDSSSSLQDDEILRLFSTEHLQPPLRAVGVRFRDLMEAILSDESVARDSQFRFGFQKLVEAKDCFVRAALP